MTTHLGLGGIGNIDQHQLIISDLIFGIRSRFEKLKIQKQYFVLSEYDLEVDQKKRKNPDISVFSSYDDIRANSPVIIAEVVREREVKEDKIWAKKYLKKFDTLQEVFLFVYNEHELLRIEKLHRNDNEFTFNHQSNVLDCSLKIMITSIKKVNRK
jgi:hypothetical protein